MDKYYKISELKEIILEIEKSQPKQKYITIKELTGNLKEVNRSLVYNLDEIMENLKVYIGENDVATLCTEAATLKILEVNRNTLYEWRANHFIRYVKLNNTLIRYKLADLLEDLEALKMKPDTMS